MPEVCCAMGIAQLEKLDYLINLRKEIANIYMEVIKDCNWLKTQKIDSNLTHSWWTFVFKLLPEKIGITWNDFKYKFKDFGGDSFYAAWSLSYMEPALYGLEFHDHNILYKEGLCPIAESIQPNLIQLKTNYKDISIAQEQAKSLLKTIEFFS